MITLSQDTCLIYIYITDVKKQKILIKKIKFVVKMKLKNYI